SEFAFLLTQTAYTSNLLDLPVQALSFIKRNGHFDDSEANYDLWRRRSLLQTGTI
ncbi:hypothetical protein GCK32_022108, partial [Trichostrongylus colubriformis]